jgi:hypothetical protein
MQVPGTIMERLVMTDVNMPAGLRHFFSAHEMPRQLTSWRNALKNDNNTGMYVVLSVINLQKLLAHVQKKQRMYSDMHVHV